MAREATTPRAARRRRTGLRRERSRALAGLSQVVAAPFFGWGLVVCLLFVAATGTLANWARERPLIAVGRVMSETWTVRVEFSTQDLEATDANRESARQLAPRVYAAEEAVFAELKASLQNLPRTLTGVTSASGVDPTITRQFGLDDAAVGAAQAEATDGEPSARWLAWVDAFVRELERRPILDDQTWQREAQAANRFVELRVGDDAIRAPAASCVNLKNPDELGRALDRMARDAGFPEVLAGVARTRVALSGKATFRFDPALTQRKQNEAAASVPPVTRTRPKGEVIFTRGEVLTPAKFELYRAEREHFRASERWRVWLRRVSVFGAVGATTLAAAGYTGLFCARIRRNPLRMGALAALMAGAVAVSCIATVQNPRLIMLSGIAPTVLIAVILVVAYDQRVALALGSLHGVLTCIALDQPIGMYALIVTGLGMAVWRLKEIRDRTSIVRMGMATGCALAVGTAIVALIDRPISMDALNQLGWDAAYAGAGGLLVGLVTLFTLPTIERTFDIVTGMALIELRDPKHPLLKLLQQKAPGTYNHSLNVASLAESAAEAIGANSLLTYVGALYHDIGKMNKPEYFVENQGGGPNKHDRLSPAMSLLVVVGHVKDGMELAREYRVPRGVQHFIESHHGTTLVEFFFHRAKQLAAQAAEKAGAGEEPAKVPDEFEYRYPGPKPQTREAAILMICDAVESAARSIPEPTPAKLDALVRTIAERRLMDGQFDECDLTLKQLAAIVESISKTLAATYHGRVQYPSTAALSVREERA